MNHLLSNPIIPEPMHGQNQYTIYTPYYCHMSMSYGQLDPLGLELETLNQEQMLANIASL